MSTTTKLKLKLIDENNVISTTDLNENYGIMETALDTTLDEVTSGTVIDYKTINNNFQTIDDEWIDTSVANATNADILSGKTAFVNKVKLTGTMANQGAATAALNAGDSYTIPAGYHNGTGKVTANSLSSQTVADATAANILSGKTAYVNGAKITGTMASQGAVNTTISAGGSYTIPAGYHNGSGKVTANSLASQTDGTATATQILSGATAYVDGAKITGTMTNRGAVSSTLNAGGSYTIPAGYHNGSGKVTANSLASQTSATATAGTILSGYTAYANGAKITGTYTPVAGKKIWTGHVIPTSNGASTLTVPIGDTVNKIYTLDLFNHGVWVYSTMLASQSIVMHSQTWKQGQGPGPYVYDPNNRYDDCNTFYFTGNSSGNLFSVKFCLLSWTRSGTNIILTPNLNPNDYAYFGYVNYSATYGYQVTVIYD